MRRGFRVNGLRKASNTLTQLVVDNSISSLHSLFNEFLSDENRTDQDISSLSQNEWGNLVFFSATRNLLKAIDSTHKFIFRKLCNITTLILSGNNISVVEDFTDLVRLSSLDLSNNEISVCHFIFFYFIPRLLVSVSGKLSCWICSDFDYVCALLSLPHILSFPPPFSHHNRLSTLEGLQRLKGLEILDVSFNLIPQHPHPPPSSPPLPSPLSPISRIGLRMLNIEGNPLTEGKEWRMDIFRLMESREVWIIGP